LPDTLRDGDEPGACPAEAVVSEAETAVTAAEVLEAALLRVEDAFVAGFFAGWIVVPEGLDVCLGVVWWK